MPPDYELMALELKMTPEENSQVTAEVIACEFAATFDELRSKIGHCKPTDRVQDVLQHEIETDKKTLEIFEPADRFANISYIRQMAQRHLRRRIKATMILLAIVNQGDPGDPQP